MKLWYSTHTCHGRILRVPPRCAEDSLSPSDGERAGVRGGLEVRLLRLKSFRWLPSPLPFPPSDGGEGIPRSHRWWYFQDVPTRRGHPPAFTLVEVILAISLAVGILVAALFFHSQATNLRAQLLRESDRIATMRLVMDRFTAELRHAFAQPQFGFTGDATSLRFVTAEAPAPPASLARSPARSAAPRTDLRLVTYGLSKTIEGTNEVVTGLTRTEQLLVEKPRSLSPLATPLAPESTNAPASGPEPMTDAVRFLRLWYWSGNGWSATWDSSQPPRGIEITLGAEPLAADASFSDYPGELFRRVIFLPTSRALDDTFDLLDETDTDPSASAPTP